MIKKIISYNFILLSVLFHCSVNAEPEILGWLESAVIKPWGIKVRAKLDSGALTSSIHATEIEIYKIDDETWVRFALTQPANKSGTQAETKVIVEKPVIKETKIKEHTGDSMLRYVVEMEFCLNGRNYRTPVTLVDRTNFHYPLLLGRRTLKNNVLIDPSKTFTANKSCLHKK
ncbi:MAG: hypothetical protein DHS20C09_20610 [marine bacterium B5-7]|nr:MAG: hypothetical protein DHS20C09_20610 [marine bacterium B5-7]